MTYEVKLTELASATASHLRVHTSTARIGDAVGQGFKELYEYAAETGAVPTGPPQLGYPGDFELGGEVDLDLYLPISTTPPPRGSIDVVVLLGGPAAQTFHRGRYEDISAANEAVFERIHTHGHAPGGPPRELYLNGPDDVTSPADYLTEVVVPVRRS